MEAPLLQPDNLLDYVLTQGNGVTGLSQLNLKTIPQKYVQPPLDRLDQRQVSVDESVPIIDLSRWDNSNDEQTSAVAKSICEAAAKWGFFQIINHGVPLEVLESVKRAAHDFFGLPVEERSKYLKGNSPSYTVSCNTSFSPLVDKVLEWKDTLAHICDGNENKHSKFWPAVSRRQVLDYVNCTKPIIQQLLGALLKGLHVKQIDTVRESLMNTLSVLLHHYPKCPNPDLATGAGRHSDISTITLLLQDDVGGLYARVHEGCDKWIHVKPVEGALVVNVGDVLQIISNGRYKSAEHRVVVSGSRNRVSVPIFAVPARETVIGPLPEVGEKPLYREVVYGELFGYFFSKGRDFNPLEYAGI